MEISLNIKHHPELPAVQQFYSTAFADRSRLWSTPYGFHNLSFNSISFHSPSTHNCFCLISKRFGRAIDFYDYRYFVPNINSQLPNKNNQFLTTKGNASDNRTILIGNFSIFSIFSLSISLSPPFSLRISSNWNAFYADRQ